MEVFAQLVFLHIEKSAGTAQWRLFDENYGRECVFRREREAEILRTRRIADIDDKIVVGGHVSLDMFRKSPRRCLYASVVREPVSRAVSLFHYFAEHGPPKDRRAWERRGLDRDSMLNTIERVPEFREAIDERQCYRLSGTKSFQAVRSILERHNCIIGHFDNLDAFNSRLAELLDWDYASLGRHNVARRLSYQEEILEEPGLKERIQELTHEDQELHRFIVERACYEHLPDEKLLRRCLGVHSLGIDSSGESTTTFQADDLKQIKLEHHDENLLIVEDKAIINLHITNEGRWPLTASGAYPIRLSYHWYDADGQMVEWEGTRTELSEHILPGEKRHLQATVTAPRTLPPGKYYIRFGLLELGKRWLETVDDSHTASIKVTYTGRAD